ncbi:heavy metal transporter [uncultured Clostridium sp.]|uniref:heavy metal transporter n=1 Tax=uncultured Clostridium sp. TaxID=59620 RepID=UPI0025FCC09F|nr:heavy metal transporter [uncultured Clostridium sp.]
MSRGEYKIRNLPNSLAKNQLKNALEKMDGVKHVSIQGNSVKVDYDKRANYEDIKHHIRGAGNKLI